MNYTNLGVTGLRVSTIALGTVELGMEYGIPSPSERLRPSKAEAGRLLHAALDLGINFIDTARAYGGSEELIGSALNARRGEYVLATKVSSFADAGLHGEALRHKVKESVAASLRALQTDVIDILQIHSAPASVIRSGEILQIMGELQKAGDVRFTGATVYRESAEEAARRGGYDCLQVAYSLLDRQPESFVLPSARKRGVGLVSRSVLLKGALTHRREFLPTGLEELRAAAAAADSLAQQAGISLPELAFRYVLSYPADLVALVGTGRLSELQAVAGYADRGPLPTDLLERVRAIEVRDRQQLDPGSWPL